MVYVALAEAAAIVTMVSVFGGLLRSQQRTHARREDLLLNQLLHAAGKTWQPPPTLPEPEPQEPTARTWTATPEQMPVY